MKHNKINARGGFTLVEIIVVLVILAILGAILIPSFTGYMDKSNENQALVDARKCVDAVQTLLTEYNVEKNGEKDGFTVDKYPEIYTEAKTLADVSGNIIDNSIKETDALLEHLKYTNTAYTVTYCSDFETCGEHTQTYTITPGGVASDQDSFNSIFTGYKDLPYKDVMDSISISNTGSKVYALYNSLSQDMQDNLKDKTWCIKHDGGNAQITETSTTDIRLYFTEKVYGATENATKVTVYKVRFNDVDGTVSYQKGTCDIVNGKITKLGGFEKAEWTDTWK